MRGCTNKDSYDGGWPSSAISQKAAFADTSIEGKDEDVDNDTVDNETDVKVPEKVELVLGGIESLGVASVCTADAAEYVDHHLLNDENVG